MFWTIVALCLAAAGLFFYHSYRRDSDVRAEEDIGLEIVEFGRAYPNEAIRQVIRTADRRSVFLRLFDGKTGCMHIHGQHYTSHLIEPGSVRVAPTDSGRGLVLDFPDVPFEGGRFEFRTAEEAAEVSLWLLGSLVPPGGLSEDPASGG